VKKLEYTFKTDTLFKMLFVQNQDLLYSRSKNFAADNHPPRRCSGGAGTAR